MELSYSSFSDYLTKQIIMLKNILKLTLIGLFLVSCSDTDEQVADLTQEETIIVNDENLIKLGLKITADKTQGNIFESFQFKLNQNNQSSYFGNLDEHLDSLVFKMSDNQTTKKLFQKLENGNMVFSTFNHNFYFPGQYNASILGYKKDKIIYKDQIIINITDKNDFLAVNWSNFLASNNSIGYSNSLMKNNLLFYSSFEDNHPYVLVMNMWDNISNYTSDQVNQKDKDYLYNYLLKFYSVPQYSDTNTTDLKNVYLQNFKKKINNDVPVNIWITTKNKIALMREYSKTNPAQFYGYRIIAESNN